MSRPLSSLLDGIALVVFDKDGTLLDFDAMWAGWAEGLGAALDAATGRTISPALDAAFGYDRPTGRAAAVGPLAQHPMAELRELTIRVVAEAADVTPAEAETLVARTWAPPDPVALAKPLTDLPALFGALRAAGIRVAIATSDDRGPTERSLAALGVAGFVDALVCADDGVPVKPDPAGMLALCAAVAIGPDRAAIVGDSAVDLAMGRAAGARRSIAVLSGAGGRSELEPLADAVIGSVAELFA